jgi:hypothetical protein
VLILTFLFPWQLAFMVWAPILPPPQTRPAITEPKR